MNCCHLFATARDLCAGLDSGDHASQLNALTALHSWLKSSLPSPPSSSLSSSSSSAGLLVPIRHSLYRCEEYDAAAAVVTTLTRLLQFMEMVPALLMSEQTDIVAATAQILALAALHSREDVYTNAWITKVIMRLCDIVKSGFDHLAFGHALEALIALSTTSMQRSVIIECGVFGYALSLLQESSSKLPGRVHCCLLWLTVMITSDAVIIPQCSDHHGFIEQHSTDLIMDVDCTDVFLQTAACYSLATMMEKSLLVTFGGPDEIRRVMDLAKQCVPFASSLLTNMVRFGPASIREHVVGSGHLDQLSAAAFSDDANGCPLSHRLMAFEQLRMLVKDDSKFRAQLAQSGVSSRLLQKAQSSTESIVVRIECLLTLAELSQHSETRLCSVDTEAAFTVVSDVMFTLSQSSVDTPYWNNFCGKLTEAVEMFTSCSPRFRSLFNSEYFCATWLGLIQESQSPTCSSRLICLLCLLDSHLRRVQKRSINSLHQYYANSDVTNTLAGLMDHSCSSVASAAFSCWMSLLDGNCMVVDGNVNGLPVSKLISLATQPATCSSRTKMVEHAMDTLSLIVDQLPIGQCRELVDSITAISLHSSTPFALRSFTVSVVGLLTVLVNRLGVADTATLNAFDRLIAALNSAGSAIAQRSLVTLNNYIGQIHVSFTAVSTVRRKVLVPSQQQHIINLVIHALLKYISSPDSDIAGKVCAGRALWEMANHDVESKVTLLNAGVVETVASFTVNSTHDLLTTVMLDLVARLCTPTDGFSIPSAARSVFSQFVCKVMDSNSMNVNMYRARLCGDIIGCVVNGEPGHCDDAVALVLQLVADLRKVTNDFRLAASLRLLLNTMTSAPLPSEFCNSYMDALPVVLDMALYHRSQAVRSYARVFTSELFTYLPPSFTAQILSHTLDTLTAAVINRNNELPVVTVQLYSLVNILYRMAKDIEGTHGIKPQHVASAVKCLMDDRLWNSKHYRDGIWYNAAWFKAEHLAQHGFFDWMVNKLTSALSNSADPAAAMLFNSFYESWEITGTLTSLGVSATIVNKMQDATELEMKNIYNLVKLLLEFDSDLAVALLRDGIVETTSAWLDANDSASGDTLLSIMGTLTRFMDTYDKSCKPQEPSPVFVDPPPHIDRIPHQPVEQHQIARHNQLLESFEQERSTVIARIQSLVTRLLSSLTASRFAMNKTVALWQLEQAGIIDSSVQLEIHEAIWSEIAGSDNSRQLTAMNALLYHLGTAKVYTSSDTAAWFASLELLPHLLDLAHPDRPLLIQSGALTVVSRLIHGRTETVSHLLARYPVTQLCSSALDASLTGCLLEPTISTLMSICQTVHKQLSMRDCVLDIIRCTQQLLQRHINQQRLPVDSFSSIMETLEVLIRQGMHHIRVFDLGIIHQLFSFAFSGIDGQYSEVANNLMMFSYQDYQLEGCYRLAMLANIEQLTLILTSNNGQHLLTSDDHLSLIQTLINGMESVDTLMQLCVDSGLLSSICQHIAHPTHSLVYSQHHFISILSHFTDDAIRSDSDTDDHQQPVANEMASVIPSLMTATIKGLASNQWNGYKPHLDTEYSTFLRLTSMTGEPINGARMFVECGGMDAIRHILRSPMVQTSHKLSFVYLLTQQNVYDHEPADLALSSLAGDLIVVPDVMPAEYDC
ncbi:hypothetical protein GQ42DRAFT_12260 [Ramicandelaber brevisporus]|nr:hypothetical protein GQ42DRAFT_12260 [Ramicandelaber brevisporus]